MTPIDPSDGVPPLSYEAAVDYLFGRINYERVPTSKYTTADFQLRRMSTLLERLGNPHLKLPVVHITGTKGKGSTAAMTAAILRAAGHRVGLCTSPHLERFEERMTVNGELPSEATIVTLVTKLKELASDLEQSDETRPTFFELSTALAWMVFEDAGCDLAVLEVGLGGRLDTTNLCAPLVTVITSISRDHMRLLGDTLELIAIEKAGIAKPGITCLAASEKPSVLSTIRTACEERRAPFWWLGSDFQVMQAYKASGPEHLPRWVMDLRIRDRTISDIHVPLAGEYQVRNAALAITAAVLAEEKLASETRTPNPSSGRRGEPELLLDDETIRVGLSQVSWPLRMEVAGHEPLIVLDAAHNDASMQELCSAFAFTSFGRKTLIFGTSRDKEAEVMLKIAGSHFEEIIITRYSTNPRAWPVVELVQIAREQARCPIRTCDTVGEALQLAKQLSSQDDLICVAGSFFLAAEARAILKPA
jgi:dihydrofolate synthase/folylpolyglutamate synthase